MATRRLNIHACFRCLDGESCEHLTVAARYRDGHADNTHEILLAIERDLLFSNLTKLSIESITIGDGAIRVSPQFQTLQQPFAARRGSQRKKQLADRAAVQWHARATGVVQ